MLNIEDDGESQKKKLILIPKSVIKVYLFISLFE